MKRFHVHVSVADLSASIRYYSALFAAEPTVVKEDYAKWMLEDPRVNFAISSRGAETGVDHLGFQTDDAAELAELKQRAEAADMALLDEGETTCCYAKSEKYWVTDPQGIAWEHFHTLSHPTGVVNPLALAALARHGLDTTSFRSKSWDEFSQDGVPKLDFVFTVCDKAAGEVCPVWPGQPMTAHWGVPDPAACEGTEAQKQQAINDATITLKRRIELFLSLPLPKLDAVALQKAVQDIGKQ